MSASRLDRRPAEVLREQLRTYRPYLGFSFFERYPQHRYLELDINESNTPKLFPRLIAANQIRIALLPILDRLLSTEENRKAIQ
jgi:hypothetical protein